LVFYLADAFVSSAATGGVELCQVIVDGTRLQRSLDGDFDGQTVTPPSDLVGYSLAPHAVVPSQ
jgi:hypothetical protein